MRQSYVIAVVGLVVVAMADPAFAHKEGDLNIGRSAAGQIRVEYAPDLFPFSLPPSPEPELTGFALDDPGFFSIDADEPDEDLYRLAAGAVIVMEIVSIDPALKAWTPFLTALPPIDDPGEQWTIGPVPFDEHAWWNIDTSDPDFDPDQTAWSATIVLKDIGPTGYADSDPVTLTFTPEPGSALLLGLGAAVVLRRRGRGV